jgi:hypothetical protein
MSGTIRRLLTGNLPVFLGEFVSTKRRHGEVAFANDHRSERERP